MKKDIIDKLLRTVYYDGEYTQQWHDTDTSGAFNESNRYLGFPALDHDSDSFYMIDTEPERALIYYDAGMWEPSQELLHLLKRTFPDMLISVEHEDGSAFVVLQEKQ